MAELTAAIYEEYSPDRQLVEEALSSSGKRLEDMPTPWRNKRIRRTIRPGPDTQAAVLGVLKKFKGLQCMVTQQPVVTPEVEEVYANQCKADITIHGKLHNTWDLMAGASLGGIVDRL